MIDNIELIKPFLKFESEDDFYYLQILQRKKENSELGSNSRVIKNYYIRSIEHLEARYEEIKTLCNIFNARAMIRLNKRSYEKVGFKTMSNLANTMMNREYSFINKSYDRACGLGHNDKEKKWILDIDYKDVTEEDVMKALNFSVEYHVLAKIPSKNGMHYITLPFRQDFFMKYCKEHNTEIEIHRDNPTNLYIP